MPYAYVCTDCGHLSSQHLWNESVDGGDLRGGPYRCAHCSCSVSQDGPVEAINRESFEARFGFYGDGRPVDARI